MLASQVMAAYAPLSPRVVVVTDRIDLDEQIAETFRRVLGDENVVRATSGGQLETLLKDARTRVITTTIHKFDAFSKKITSGAGKPIVDPNVFVFVDEGHRTQTGSLHAAMRRALPVSCLVGFTGTPLSRLIRRRFLDTGSDSANNWRVPEARIAFVIAPRLAGRSTPAVVKEATRGSSRTPKRRAKLENAWCSLTSTRLACGTVSICACVHRARSASTPRASVPRSFNPGPASAGSTVARLASTTRTIAAA
jgi:hypothetical protein